MLVRFAMMASEAKDQAVAAGSLVVGSAAMLQWFTDFAGMVGGVFGAASAIGAVWLLHRRLQVVELERKLREMELDKRMED